MSRSTNAFLSLHNLKLTGSRRKLVKINGFPKLVFLDGVLILLHNALVHPLLATVALILTNKLNKF